MRKIRDATFKVVSKMQFEERLEFIQHKAEEAEVRLSTLKKKRVDQANTK